MRRRFVSIAWRVAADACIAAGSLAAAFGIRFSIALVEPQALPPRQLMEIFLSYFLRQAPLLAALLIAIFGLFGVYTRTRFYTRRFKAVALLQAVSLTYGLFLFAVYIFRQGAGLMPRGALLLAYGLTLAGAIAPRLVKDFLQNRFTVEPRRPPSERAIRKVLVVGGAGYIGSVLVRDLLEGGYRVRVLDALLYGDESVRQICAHPELELVRGDFRHVGPAVQAMKGIDAVIHLGAIVGDPACAVDEDETLETNLAATRLLADVARASRVSRILFASTCSVYGAADHPVDERSHLNPVSLYAATKIDSENVLLAARDRQFHPVILRLATAFGWSPRPRFDLVVNLLAAKAAVEKKILIFNGEQWRPFIHVKDISRAFRSALSAPLEVVSGEIFNAGSNSMNFTLRQLAGEIAALEPGLAVEYVDNADARNYCVTFDKIRAALRFDCRTSLGEGIREIQEAIRSGQVGDYREPRYSNQQLAAQRHKEGLNAEGEITLTALQFAKNSLWWRTLARGGDEDTLLQNHATGLLALARAVQTEGAPKAKEPLPSK